VNPPAPLPASALYRRCDLSAVAFETTRELAPLAGLIGQERALEAVSMGVGLRARGYNVFALGPAGIGKRSLVEQLLAVQPRQAPRYDWCYVNNFKEEHRPRALQLPPGIGIALKKDMSELVEELCAAIPALFESEEYRSRSEQIGAQIDERTQAVFEDVGQAAAARDLVLLHTPAGFSFAPVKNGEVIVPDEYAKLPEDTRERIEASMEELQGSLQKAVRQAQRLQKERRDLLKALNRQMTLAVVSTVIEEIRHRRAELPQVLGYLDEVQADILDHIEDFRRSAEPAPEMAALTAELAPTFQRYQVNVVSGADGGAGDAPPIVIEDYPTYQNLLGRIENVARFGTLATDFTLIKSGALHRANGGYLLLDAFKLLSQPFAWDGLKRALSSREIRTESLGQTYGLVSTVALEPEPIALDVKVIMFGERWTYYWLQAVDPEFVELFKIAADFEDDLPRVAQTEVQLARLIGTLLAQEKLPPFERGAVERVIEHAARLCGDASRLSAHLESVVDLLREAAHLSGTAPSVARACVEQALAAQRRRASRVEERIRDATLRGELMIATTGEAVGQVNALSVSSAGGYAFGHPSRVTATTRLGDGELIDVQREVDLGGPSHTKGVLILSSFLAQRYSSERPHSLTASLAFEQTYGEVDGDSASVAELCALLSSLANLPIRQSFAITGSVNQRGEVQPIGGVNDKIEGFFDLCAARGLDGTQGVVIPAANAPHLMLKSAVTEAAANSRFHVYAVRTVDEAIALLTGVEAGELNGHGDYPKGSVNSRVMARLNDLAVLRQAVGQPVITIKTVRKTEKKPAAPPAPRK
jgi:predicted ATP-dependent protease